MNVDFTWLYKFFTYSSIQVKFIATFIAIFVLAIVRRIFVSIVHRRVDDTFSRYRWQKAITYITFIVGIFTIGRIWFEGVQSIATYLGLLSAGVAIALRDPITNIIGWTFILWRSPFNVGDRIQIGDNAGDVIDINFFKFTVMEIGNWIDGDSNTGRIIHIPNGKVFTENLANYSKGFKYIWNELKVLVTFESNWKDAKDILNKISDSHAEIVSKAAANKYEEVSKIFMIHKPKFKPEVYTKVEDSGINLTVRYLCDPRKRRSTAQSMWEDILNQFEQRDDIEFAYPTMRYYTQGEEVRKKQS